mmetsp:Transcript_87607/g.225696  ORF Transcript_87607/g.225696 Transcript_87607/m.225696 type:complete len:288 (+) Transcript_87607:546-1409(+)
MRRHLAHHHPGLVLLLSRSRCLQVLRLLLGLRGLELYNGLLTGLLLVRPTLKPCARGCGSVEGAGGHAVRERGAHVLAERTHAFFPARPAASSSLVGVLQLACEEEATEEDAHETAARQPEWQTVDPYQHADNGDDDPGKPQRCCRRRVIHHELGRLLAVLGVTGLEDARPQLGWARTAIAVHAVVPAVTVGVQFLIKQGAACGAYPNSAVHIVTTTEGLVSVVDMARPGIQVSRGVPVGHLEDTADIAFLLDVDIEGASVALVATLVVEHVEVAHALLPPGGRGKV